MNIVIASGKGGTGKTTLSVALSEAIDEPLTLLDCDVEEPNCHLFFDDATTTSRPVTQLVPTVNTELCDGCGKCSELCQFNAIISFAGADAMVFPDLCHSCGGCIEVCPTGAITEIPFEIGAIEKSSLSPQKNLITGRLAVGHAMAPPIIKEVFKEARSSQALLIADAPPGSSCPFVTAAKEADFVIFITEPTPFGLHDLTIAIATLQEIGTPFGVVVNRITSADNRITDYCCKEGIPVLLQIAESRAIAENYSQGFSLLKAMPSLKEKLQELYRRIQKEVA